MDADEMKYERVWFRIIMTGSKISPGQKQMERTCFQPYSSRGEKELSQVSQNMRDYSMIHTCTPTHKLKEWATFLLLLYISQSQ